MGLRSELLKDWGSDEKRRYNLKLIALGLMLLGFFFMWEHLWAWGYLEFELFGHETLGLVLLVAGVLMGIYLRRWKRAKSVSRRISKLYTEVYRKRKEKS